MKLYENGMKEFQMLINAHNVKELAAPTRAWPLCKQEELLLRGDTAFELGGGTKQAIGGLAFTTEESLVKEDGTFLIGRDLGEIGQDTDYARITFIRLKKDVFEKVKDNEAYDMLRRIDFARYHVYPKGYMLRISAVKEREIARVSNWAKAERISFVHVGECFAREYHLRPEVEAVQTYFITEETFAYQQCKGLVHQWEQITESLNHIFQGISMDCGSCNLKEICDEVEGLRQMHLGSGATNVN